MPATKIHPACTIHEDGMSLPHWLNKKKTVTYAKKKKKKKKISPKMVNTRDIALERRRRRRRRQLEKEQTDEDKWGSGYPGLISIVFLANLSTIRKHQLHACECLTDYEERHSLRTKRFFKKRERESVHVVCVCVCACVCV